MIATAPFVGIDAEHPWPGLMPFGEEAQAFFHGRDQEVAELLRLIKRETLTVLFGQSGLGKSSLLNAGLAPRLRSEDYFPVYVRLDIAAESADFRQQVWQRLHDEAERHRIEAPAADSGESLWAFFHRHDADLWSARNRILTPVLVFDQFEELFTLGRHGDELADRCRDFIAELGDLVEDRLPQGLAQRLEEHPEEAARYAFGVRRYKVVMSFREDYLPEFEGLRPLIRSIMQNRLRLTRMNGAQAMEAVLKSASHLVLPSVAEQIIRFVAAPRAARGGGAELDALEVEPALLSVVCRELNSRRLDSGRPQISAELLQGGAQREIIEGFYESSLSDLGPQLRAFVEDQLLTESGYRDSCALDDALRVPGVTRAALDTLVARRLLRLEERSGVLRVELTHDLLTSVVKDSRDRRIESEARQQALQAETARRRKARRFAALGAAVAFVAVGVAGVFAILLDRANKDKARLLETQSSIQLDNAIVGHEDGVASEPYARLAQAIRLAPDNQAAVARAASLLATRGFPALLASAAAPGPAEWTGWLDAERIAVGIDGGIAVWSWRTKKWQAAVFSGSGDIYEDYGLLSLRLRELNAAGDKAPRSGAGAAPAKRQRDGKSHHYDPESRTYAYRTAELAWVFFDAESGKKIAGPLITGARPTNFRLSPDRRWAAFVDAGALRLTRLDTMQTTSVPLLGDGDPRAVMLGFGADGRQLLIRLEGGETRLLTMPADGKAASVATLAGDDRSPGFAAAQLSPDGQLVALARGRDVAWYQAATGQAVGRPLRHTQPVNVLAFSGDGKILATGSQDKSVRLWSVAAHEAIGAPLRHEGSVLDLAFSGDGRRLVSAAQDGTARVWDVVSGRPAGEPLLHGVSVNQVQFSPDGEKILSLAEDGSLRIWRLQAPAARTLDVDLAGVPEAAQMSPDGRRLAIADRNGMVALWPVPGTDGSAAAPALKAEWTRAVDAAPAPLLRFSPDASRLAVALRDGRIQVLDTAGGQPLGPPLRTSSRVTALAFSRDGALLAAGTANRAVWLFATTTLAPVGLPMIHGGEVTQLAFSADGQVLLSAAADQKLRAWETRGTLLVGVRDMQERIAAVAFVGDTRDVLTVAGKRVAHWRLAATLPAVAEDGDEPGDALAAKFAARLAERSFPAPIYSAAVHPTGKRLALGGIDGTARLVDSMTLVPLGAPIRHDGVVIVTNFVGGGRLLVSRSVGGTLRISDGASGQSVADAIDGGGAAPVLDDVAGDGDLHVEVTRRDHGGRLRFADLRLGVALPAPAWLPGLVEASGGSRIDASGSVVAVASRQAEIDGILSRADGQPDGGWWAGWLRQVGRRLGADPAILDDRGARR